MGAASLVVGSLVSCAASRFQKTLGISSTLQEPGKRETLNAKDVFFHFMGFPQQDPEQKFTLAFGIQLGLYLVLAGWILCPVRRVVQLCTEWLFGWVMDVADSAAVPCWEKMITPENDLLRKFLWGMGWTISRVFYWAALAIFVPLRIVLSPRDSYQAGRNFGLKFPFGSSGLKKAVSWTFGIASILLSVASYVTLIVLTAGLGCGAAASAFPSLKGIIGTLSAVPVIGKLFAVGHGAWVLAMQAIGIQPAAAAIVTSVCSTVWNGVIGGYRIVFGTRGKSSEDHPTLSRRPVAPASQVSDAKEDIQARIDSTLEAYGPHSQVSYEEEDMQARTNSTLQEAILLRQEAILLKNGLLQKIKEDDTLGEIIENVNTCLRAAAQAPEGVEPSTTCNIERAMFYLIAILLCSGFPEKAQNFKAALCAVGRASCLDVTSAAQLLLYFDDIKKLEQGNKSPIPAAHANLYPLIPIAQGIAEGEFSSPERKKDLLEVMKKAAEPLYRRPIAGTHRPQFLFIYQPNSKEIANKLTITLSSLVQQHLPETPGPPRNTSMTPPVPYPPL